MLSMSMSTVLLLVCSLCAGQSRRVQANHPAAAFMPSGQGARLPEGDATRTTSQPSMMQIPLLGGGSVAKEAKGKSFDVKELAGITEPFGFFDPLGLSEGVSEGRLRFYREAELKHGRLGMLAALGFLVAEQWHPLFGGDIDVPSYLAFQQTPLEKFWGLVVAAISVNEVYSVFTFNDPNMPVSSRDQSGSSGEPWSIRSDHEPGNLLFDPLKLRPEDPKEWLEMQNKELNNGRLAMLAAAGMIAQELVTGEKLF
mmetsp:Transcript_56338/g.103370  ORF Transcript_56338/g.103370 Transcript_56338/m.103370 type:complete len:255 (-) Transcript_56338:348-1112(-)